jgi:DNA-binding CsgD family transcriptional regulator
MSSDLLRIVAKARPGSRPLMIGERLSLSVRTVDNHLRKADEKLGVRGRHELGPAIAHW